MYLNKFSARIEGGKEDHSGYVKIPHRKKYKIVLKNDWDEPCNARVKVDGKDIGEGQSFRIPARGSMRLERPVNDDGCFTFFRSDSAEGEASGVSDISVSDRGLVEVTFTPGSQRLKPLEKHHHYHYYEPIVWHEPKVWPEITWNTYEPYAWSPQTPFTLRGTYGSSGPCRNVSDVQVNYSCTAPMAAGSEVAEGVTGLSGHSNQSYRETYEIDLDYSRQTTITLRLVEDVNGNAIDARPVVSRGNIVPPPVV